MDRSHALVGLLGLVAGAALGFVAVVGVAVLVFSLERIIP